MKTILYLLLLCFNISCLSAPQPNAQQAAVKHKLFGSFMLSSTTKPISIGYKKASNVIGSNKNQNILNNQYTYNNLLDQLKLITLPTSYYHSINPQNNKIRKQVYKELESWEPIQKAFQAFKDEHALKFTILYSECGKKDKISEEKDKCREPQIANWNNELSKAKAIFENIHKNLNNYLVNQKR